MSKYWMQGAVLALAGCAAGAAWAGGAAAQRIGAGTVEVIRLNELGTEDYPHVLDMARESALKISAHKAGAAHVRVINLLPSRLSSYVLEFETTRISMPAWEDPRQAAPGTDTPRSMLAKDSCEALKTAIQNLLTATEETQVPDLLTRLADASQRVAQEIEKQQAAAAAAGGKKGKTPPAPEAAGAGAAASGDAPDQEDCASHIKVANELPSRTSRQFEFDLKRGSEATLRMRRGDLKREIVVRSEPREWLTHVGFTFMDNLDERYFSREIAAAPGTYEVARQGGGQDIKYAATALFTYPVSNFASGVNLGFTAGLGASAESVAVVAGIGVIFGENVLFTVGAAVQEFDVLKGVYREGQALGAAPVDSSALVDKTYKVSPMATLGFRFGGK